MRRFQGLVLILLACLLWSCNGGGGGGSTSPPAVVYSGQMSQATITADNAMEFASFVLGEGLFTLPPTEMDVGTGASFLTRVEELSRQVFTALESMPVSGGWDGAVSGTVTYAGTAYSDGTAVLTYTYTNFNDGDGYIYDGKVTVRVHDFDFDLGLIRSGSIETSKLVIQTDGQQMTLTGNATLETDPLTNRETGTLNFDGRDDSTLEIYRIEDLQSIMTCDNILAPTYCSEENSGRIYLESEGYVEVALDTPLIYNYYGRFGGEDIPDAGGPLRLLGAGGTEIVVTPLSISQVRLGIDTDGDGTPDYGDVYLWTDLIDIVFTFEATLGTANFDVAFDGQTTNDGGYVVVGWTNTMADDGLEAYLVKTNAVGEREWESMYGGVGDQEFRAVLQTADGGYAMIGTSTSVDIPAVDFIYVVRTDQSGNELWSQTWTGEFGDVGSNGYAIHENTDGSLMVVGNAYSWGPVTGDVDGSIGFEDVYLAKLDSGGVLIWEKRLGGADWDYAYSILQAADGGYVLAGTTGSFDFATLREELYLLKTDADGNLLWEVHFDAVGSDVAPLSQYGYDVVEDTGTNLVVVGSTQTLAFGDVPYLVKLDSAGTLIWETRLTDQSLLRLRTIDATSDGHYILAGDDHSDMRLIKMDATGTVLWDRSFNWGTFHASSAANAVRATNDGGFVAFGSAWPSEGKDFYIVKTNELGELW